MVGPRTFVTCPGCGRGVTVSSGTMSTGSGSLPVQCPLCHKTFRLIVKNGSLVGVQ